MRAPKPTVLMGFAEAIAAPETAWSLFDEGFQVIAFARRGRGSPVCHSRLVEVHEVTAPEVDLETSLSDLHMLLRSLDTERAGAPRIIFPLDDAAVLLCNKVQPEHPEWALAGPQGVCAELALNKFLQTEMARQAGFDVPSSWCVRSAEDASSLGRVEPFPIILKTAECVPVRSGRIRKGGLWICASSQEFERAIAQWDKGTPLLAQQFITGTGEGVFGIATSQRIQAWSAHCRVRMMNPHGSGSSACVSRTVDPDIRSKVESLVSRIGWRGLFMIEFLRDAYGKLWFVELNGRPWGSIALSRRQGLEYPAWQAKLALGEDPVANAPASLPGVVCRNVGRELMHILFVIRGPKSRVLSGWPSFWKTVGQVFRIHRGDHIYNWRRQDPMVFLADCYYTLHDNLLKSRT